MANGLHKLTVQEGTNAQLGQGGADIVTAATVNQTTNPGVDWVAITVLAGNVDAGEHHTARITATPVDTDLWDSPSSLVVPVGVTIYGIFRSIELDSGTVLSYAKGGTNVEVNAS